MTLGGYACDPVILYEVEGCRGSRVAVCRGVYEPAEDTWMMSRVLEGRARATLCVDVGTGTGILATCMECGYIVATDVNPCAVLCAARNLSSARVDVVQCNGVSCIRPLAADALVAFNAPYLPEEPSDNIEAAWAGGMEVIGGVLRAVAEWSGCWEAYLTVSSVTPSEALEKLAARLRLRAERVAAMHEDFFVETYVYRVTPQRCASRRPR